MIDIIGDVIGAVFRFIFIDIIVDVVGHVLVRVPGRAIARMLPWTKDLDPDGAAVCFIGLALWAVLAGTGYALYRALI